MEEILLTRGKVALVDDEDYEWLNQYKWSANYIGGKFYAVRSGPRPQKETIYLHRVVMGTPKGMDVDHINGDGLDNRRSNLRLSTHTENLQNQRKRPNNTSGFKGVSWKKQDGKWRARITVNGKAVALGHFDDLEEAALAYDKAAIEHFGEFARLNFPEMGGI